MSDQDAVLADVQRQLEAWTEPQNDDTRYMLSLGRRACEIAASLKAQLERMIARAEEYRAEREEQRDWVEQTKAQLSAVTKELEQFRAAADTSICAWCGEVGPKTAEHILAHQEKCEVRKDGLETDLRQLRADRDEWKAQHENLLALYHVKQESEARLAKERDEWKASSEYWHGEHASVSKERDQLRAERDGFRALLASFEERLKACPKASPDSTIKEFLGWLFPVINGFGNDVRAALSGSPAGETERSFTLVEISEAVADALAADPDYGLNEDERSNVCEDVRRLLGRGSPSKEGGET